MAEKPTTKNDGNHSITDRVLSFFSPLESKNATSKKTDESNQRSKKQYASNEGGSDTNGSRTQTLTLTQQVDQRMPTLILKLQEKHKEQLKGKSEKEQEEYIKQHIDSFREMLHRNIDEFQALVLSARPSPNAVNDPDYEQQKEVYRELLKAATNLISHMQATLNKVLTDYRLFVEELWETICADKDPSPIIACFRKQTDAYMKQSWNPIFARADKMMEEIESSRKKHADKH